MKIYHKTSGKLLFEVEAETLRGANLQEANLRRANLQEADLRWADLRRANLQEADLRWANLQWANLRGANLQEADLRGADLDLSCLPLSCGAFNMKVDTRFVWQLIAHIGRLDTQHVSESAKTALKALKPYVNEFCRYRNDVEEI